MSGELPAEIITHTCQECGKELPLKRDKKGKLYYVCDDCGVQHFIRNHEGMARALDNIKKRRLKNASKETKTSTESTGQRNSGAEQPEPEGFGLY